VRPLPRRVDHHFPHAGTGRCLGTFLLHLLSADVRQSVGLFDELIHQVLVLRLALLKGLSLSIGSRGGLSQQFQSLCAAHLCRLLHVVAADSVLVEKEKSVGVSQFCSLQEVISCNLLLVALIINFHVPVLVEQAEIDESLTVSLHRCLLITNLGLCDVLPNMIPRIVVIAQFYQRRRILKPSRLVNVVVGAIRIYFHPNALLLKNTHQIQSLRVSRLSQQYLPKVFMNLHINLALDAHLVAYHAFNKLQLALAVIELGPFNVQRSRLLRVLPHSQSLLVAFTVV
jgi:hypothetical protein